MPFTVHFCPTTVIGCGSSTLNGFIRLNSDDVVVVISRVLEKINNCGWIDFEIEIPLKSRVGTTHWIFASSY